MTFSARSLPVKGTPGGFVPLIGDDETMSPSRDRKRSGEAEATRQSAAGTRTTAENGAGLPSARAAPRAATSAVGSTGADSLRVRLTW